jgi:starvation-inducible DNA-binding protein
MKQTVPHDFKAADRLDIAKAVNPLVADAFALYIKTKNFHWHISGSHFRDYHLLLDEQAEQIFAMIDILAERVRKLGETTIHSVGHIRKLQEIEDDDEVLEPKEMLRHLMNDNKNFTSRMRAAHQICSERNDVGTTSVLEDFIDEAERRTWFLFEILS